MPWRSRRTPTSVSSGALLEQFLDLHVLAETELEDEIAARAQSARRFRDEARDQVEAFGPAKQRDAGS